MTDVTPAAENLCALITAVPDGDLDRPTPCTDYPVGGLLNHLEGVTVTFGAAAAKARDERADLLAWGDASKLDADWRMSLPRRVRELAAAWGDPDAWTGMTRISGAESPAEVVGTILLGELIVHGWDLSRGTALPLEVDAGTLTPLYELVRQVFGPDQDQSIRGPAFGPAVPVPAEAPPLDQVLGLLGRDPAWSAT